MVQAYFGAKETQPTHRETNYSPRRSWGREALVDAAVHLLWPTLHMFEQGCCYVLRLLCFIAHERVSH